MRYVLIDSTANGDTWTKEFNDIVEALRTAEYDWSSMSDYDKKKCDEFMVIDSVNENEEADNHLDGRVVVTWKRWNNVFGENCHRDEEPQFDYVVSYFDHRTGAKSIIENTRAERYYTGNDYAIDCIRNADYDWLQLLENGSFDVDEIEED